MEYFSYALSIKDRIFEDIGLTFYMLFLSAIFSGIFGLIIGVTLVVTNEGGILENKKLYSILDKITNLFRAVPFIILLAVISPLTNLIAGTRIGPTAIARFPIPPAPMVPAIAVRPRSEIKVMADALTSDGSPSLK